MHYYNVMCRNLRTDELERLDWTWTIEEANAWTEAYKKDDDEAREAGASIDEYEYFIEEVDDEEDEDDE